MAIIKIAFICIILSIHKTKYQKYVTLLFCLPPRRFSAAIFEPIGCTTRLRHPDLSHLQQTAEFRQ
jgi:hypothetical protein